MQKLHMVGFTTDHRGLIFSVRRGAKSGGYVVNIDASIIEAVDELKALLAEEAADESISNAHRPQSALSVREIQARLRRGRTVEQVAREAGVDASWILRFADPVLAEQAEVIRAARQTHMTKQRNNVSATTLVEAVYRNLADRGVTDPRDQLDKAWRARQLTEGMWLITFTYAARGRDNRAQWEYDETNRVVRARGRLGGVIGWREPPRRALATTTRQPARRTAKKSAKKKKAAKKTTPAKRGATKRPAAAPSPRAPRTAAAKKAAAAAPTTARQSASRIATRRVSSLRRAAAAKLEAEAEKATRRDIAALHKAAKRPVVIPPRLVPPPLLFEEPVEEEDEVVGDLELRWDAAPIEIDPEPEANEESDVEDEPEADADDEGEAHDVSEVEDEPEAVAEVEDLGESDDEPASEPEPEPEPAAEPEPAPNADPEPQPVAEPQPELRIPRPPRRREPLRARPPVQPVADTNGPVFRDDLAPAAGDVIAVARSAIGQSPDVPLSMPLEPIEPPPKRRRLRPLRGR